MKRSKAETQCGVRWMKALRGPERTRTAINDPSFTSGVTASSSADGNIFSFTAANTRTAVQLGDGSTATAKVANLGFTATDFAAGSGAPSSQSALAGKSITVQVGSGAGMNTATITFGTAPGQVSTLAQLNEALAPANAQALSTRNSLAISALSLANQSQQGILQFLR